MTRAAKVLAEAARLLLGMHVQPDGDTLGATLALARALAVTGKEVTVVSPSPVPPLYRFLAGTEAVVSWSQVRPPYDAVVLLDCSDPGRTGAPAPLEQYGRPVVNVDHHPTNSGYGDVTWIDTQAAAVGELALRLIDELDVPLDLPMAEALYVSLVTDTGGFRYTNTTPSAHRMAARLLEAGVDVGRVSEHLHERLSLASVRLLARALSRLQVDPSLPVAWITLSSQDLEEAGATVEDVEAVGTVGFPRALEGIEVAFLLRPEGREEVKVSLRSKRWVDVAEIAASLGGGGHARAAGATLRMPLAQAEATVRQAVAQALSRGVG
ncbi:MAG: bifunctional oligoribonuclease/PAP phosphatase NrnA [Conexivisphaerales archaeon]